jgi:FlaA1/EpsC-like NDP-sugar epimerase
MIVLDAAAQERVLGRQLCEVLTVEDRVAFRGKHVLITGAGGSVGGELARQLLMCGVARLTLLDHSEYALFRIDGELRQSFAAADIRPVLADVTRSTDVRAAFRASLPDIVYHAAAYKHVTFAETAVVPALRVNALGAWIAARAASEVKADFVLISSDKAAEPRSVMGATKRFAEHLVLAEATPGFTPLVVRFGNILGSSGSVVEIMLRQAAAGLPIPITDPDATRYFMTAAEAVSLVLKAGLIRKEPGIFWLDMGEPIRIGDLAMRIVDEALAAGYPRVDMTVIGLRPGEKPHEELTSQGLSMQPTGHARIFGARQRRVATATLVQARRTARSACASGNARAALSALCQLVDDFVPSGTALRAAGEKEPAEALNVPC